MGAGHWERLVEPRASIEDPGDRRTARAVAALLVVLLPLGVISDFAQLALVPGYWPVFVCVLVALAVLGVAYALSRGPRFRAAAILTAGTVTLASLVSAATGPRPEVSFSFLLLGPILASFLLSARETFGLVLVGAAGMIVDTAYDPQITGASISGPLSFHLIAGALIVVGRRHRDNVELDRRSKLAQSEEISRLLLEASFDAVLLTRAGAILAASGGCERVFGIAPGGLVGRQVRELFEMDDAIVELFTSDHGRLDAVGKNGGRRFPAEIAFRSGHDSVRAIAVRDLTETRLLEARLRLENRLVSLGTLTAGVAHELNNPLAYVGLNVELGLRVAKERALDEQIRALLCAKEGLDRMADIVRGLKTFARGDELQVGPVDVTDVLRSTLRMVAVRLKELRVIEGIEEVPFVHANAARLGQVFTNLLLNAVQATTARPDPEIRIETKSTGRSIEIAISDNGEGIPADALERIFDPFFTTKEVGEGTGLGLAICHGIVSGFGGDIHVESTVGEGTRFVVSLPQIGAASDAA